MRKTKLQGKAWKKALKEAHMDPQFRKEIKVFIKATTTIHKL